MICWSISAMTPPPLATRSERTAEVRPPETVAFKHKGGRNHADTVDIQNEMRSGRQALATHENGAALRTQHRRFSRPNTSGPGFVTR